MNLTTVDFQKDDRVSHARFGPGVVLHVDSRYTIVEFDEGGARKFVTAMIQLEPSELPVPPKPAPPRPRRRSAKVGDSSPVRDEAGSEVSERETMPPER